MAEPIKDDVVEGIRDYVKRMAQGWKKHKSLSPAKRKSWEAGWQDPAAPWIKTYVNPAVRRGYQARAQRGRIALGSAAAAAGIAALGYGASRALRVRREYLAKRYTPSQLAKARWRRRVGLSGGATSGALMGLAGGAAHLATKAGAMSRADMVRFLAKTGLAGATAGGTVGYAFTPGPQRYKVESAVKEIAADGHYAKDVVECLLKEVTL